MKPYYYDRAAKSATKCLPDLCVCGIVTAWRAISSRAAASRWRQEIWRRGIETGTQLLVFAGNRNGDAAMVVFAVRIETGTQFSPSVAVLSRQND